MSVNEKLKSPMNDQLFSCILKLETLEECYEFFEDICTVQEIKAIAMRLEVARMLEEGIVYDEIVQQTGASTATISRIKRCLVYGAGGYRRMLARMEQNKESK